MKSSKSFPLVLAGILVAGFALRVYHITLQGHWNSDGLLYYELARGLFFDGKVLIGNATRTLISGGNLDFYDNLFLQGKFGHILLIALAFGVAGIRIQAPLILNVFLGTATVYVIYLLGRQVFNRDAGLIAAGLSAFSLIFINYSRSALTPSGSMFFFTLGLYLLFRHLKSGEGEDANAATRFVHPLFPAGLLIGYSFTIHYNLAWYFLLVYFSHLIYCLARRRDQRQKALRGNLIFAAGLAFPIIFFEFAYPLGYYLVHQKHTLYTYFEEVLFNALEAGGGSSIRSYFLIFLWAGENPVYCIVTILAGFWFLFRLFKEWNASWLMLFLFAWAPPAILSLSGFPLVGRNLAPSLPLFAVISGYFIERLSSYFGEKARGAVAAGLALIVLAPGFLVMGNFYKLKSPYIQARKDIQDKGILLLSHEDLYRDAVLYAVSKEISVVPSFQSILQDPKSRDYLLMTRPSTPLPEHFKCEPRKTYSAYDSTRIPPIRYEDRVTKKLAGEEYHDVFTLYDLSKCLEGFEFPSPPSSGAKSVTEIGRNYSLPDKKMTSLYRVQYYTGLEYLKAGYNEEAVVEFKKAVAQNPNLVHGYNNLAAALHNQKDYEAALETLRTAEPLAPAFPGTQNLLGLVHYSRGEFDQSIEHFKKSVQLDPQQPVPYQYLINIYGVVKNDPSTARFYAEQLKSLK